MATIIFYEKPGCINNTKQKALLRAAGHDVHARNLLLEPWTRERLLRFFGDRPVVEWLNPTAPQIKSGQINPTRLNAVAALNLMLAEPLLIRRPLIRVGDRCEVGFDIPTLKAWIGFNVNEPKQNLETCPRTVLATSPHPVSPSPSDWVHLRYSMGTMEVI